MLNVIVSVFIRNYIMTCCSNDIPSKIDQCWWKIITAAFAILMSNKNNVVCAWEILEITQNNSRHKLLSDLTLFSLLFVHIFLLFKKTRLGGTTKMGLLTLFYFFTIFKCVWDMKLCGKCLSFASYSCTCLDHCNSLHCECFRNTTSNILRTKMIHLVSVTSYH